MEGCHYAEKHLCTLLSGERALENGDVLQPWQTADCGGDAFQSGGL